MSIGHLILQLRNTRITAGLSQRQLPGINHRQLSTWETGVWSPALVNLERWAAALGLELMFVRTGQTVPPWVGKARPRVPKRAPHPLVAELREERLAIGMPREATGFNVEQLKQWELGKHHPSPTNLDRYAQVLGFRLVLEATD